MALDNLPSVWEEEIPLNITWGQESQREKSFEEYKQEQEHFLNTIDAKNPVLRKQAEEEFKDVSDAFDALKGDTSEVAKLQLADLHQEFERDIRGMELLENSDFKKIFKNEEEFNGLINCLNTIDTDWATEEKFYSILTSMSSSAFNWYLISFADEESDTFIANPGEPVNSIYENFINTFIEDSGWLIESEEKDELQDLDVNTLKTKEAVEYYQEQIKLLTGNVSKNVKEILDDLPKLVFEEKDKDIWDKYSKLEIRKRDIKATADAEKATADANSERIKWQEFMNNYSDTYENLPDSIKNNYKDLANIFKEIGSFEWDLSVDNKDQIEALSIRLDNKLSEKDKNWITNAEKFLLDLGKEKPEMYTTMLHSFRDLSDVLAISLAKYPDEYELIENITPKPDPVGWTDVDKLNWYNVIGNIATKRVDWDSGMNRMKNYNEVPPQSYIVMENGFKLNSTVDYPQTEIDENQKIFEEKNEELTDIISDRVSRHQELVSQRGELLNTQADIKEQLNNSELSSEDRWALEEQAQKIEQELVDINNEINQVDTVIQETEAKLNKVAAAFEKWHQEQIDTYNQLVESKDKKAIEVWEFLQGIWFNLIPPSITQSILMQLNTSWFNGKRNQMWFNSKFDLDNGVLGYENSFDKKNLSLTEKVIFAEFMNRMISWDRDQPIDIKIVLAGWDAPVNVDKLNIQLQELGLKDSWTWITTAMANIDKSLIPKTTQINKDDSKNKTTEK